MTCCRNIGWMAAVVVSALAGGLIGSELRAQSMEKGDSYISPGSGTRIRMLLDEATLGHVHGATEIFYVLSGELEHVVNGKSYILKEGEHPVLLTMLEDGRLHLSGIAVLAPHLTFANCEELLARATHKTKREILVLVAEMEPKPDVRPPSGSFRSGDRNRQARTARQARKTLRPERVVRLLSPTSLPKPRISRRSSNRWHLRAIKSSSRQAPSSTTSSSDSRRSCRVPTLLPCSRLP